MTWRRLIEQPQQWVLACCAVALLLVIGGETWRSLQAVFYRPAASVAALINTPEHGRDFATRIIDAALFGHAAPQANSQTPPETNLQLTLRGVFTSQDAHHASAMIETSDGRVQIVKVGANAAPDTVLQQVFGNYVVLLRNGAPESLYFPTPQESAGDVALAQNTAPANNETSTPGPENNDNTGASPEEIKRAAILRRLEELRSRSSH